FDLLVSALLLILLSPLMLVLALLVWTKLGWPVIFTQERPGKERCSTRIRTAPATSHSY
ncbi:MAG: sugar transferase, partial [Anaerolineaceae bacterium]|nr:sugar transferase [Anaerolineaceae bacterium]